MFDERRCPLGRLFYVPGFVTILLSVSWGQTPTSTTVADIVYRADGGLASGTLLISRPTFRTAAGHSVAAGRKSVTLGTVLCLNASTWAKPAQP